MWQRTNPTAATHLYVHTRTRTCTRRRYTKRMYAELHDHQPTSPPPHHHQAYVLLKVGAARGPLDFQQQGGHDTAWLQVCACVCVGLWVSECVRVYR